MNVKDKGRLSSTVVPFPGSLESFTCPRCYDKQLLQSYTFKYGQVTGSSVMAIKLLYNNGGGENNEHKISRFVNQGFMQDCCTRTNGQGEGNIYQLPAYREIKPLLVVLVLLTRKKEQKDKLYSTFVRRPSYSRGS